MRRGCALAVLLLVAGCGGAPARLIGKWEFDPETMNFSPAFRRLSPEEKKGALAQTRWDLQFTADELTWNHSMWGWGSLAFKTKYKVVSHDGNRVTIEAGPAGTLVFTVTDVQLRFGFQGRPILLRRKR